MNVVIIGTGNVALVLAKLLMRAGHTITGMYGRNTDKLSKIAAHLGVKAISNLQNIGENAEICILAVSDNAVATVTQNLPLSDVIVVHTSGAVSKTVLNRFKRHGVLYPLQSLRKELDYLPDIPFFTDGSDEDVADILSKFAATVSGKVSRAGDGGRLRLHTAAVLCSNFTNHLYALTQQFCKEENIDFNYLLPLINETAARLSYSPAYEMQTGPAVRNDSSTIQRHLQLLQRNTELLKIYIQLTDSIQHFHAEKNPM